MKKLSFEKEDVYSGNLILVNVKHPIQYGNAEGLSTFRNPHAEVFMKDEAAAYLTDIFHEIGCGDEIVPVSGYRPAREQMDIYEDTLWEKGLHFTRQYVALPYHSEHQLGLAIDLGLKQETIDFVCPDFPYEGICHDFRKAAPHYGFVERYQREKEDITGISHEPWHFRYVGYPHSRIMSERQLCLEEYVEFIKEFPYDQAHFYDTRDGQETEIFYVPMNEIGKADIRVPKESICRVSGNNVDGLIVSVMVSRAVA